MDPTQLQNLLQLLGGQQTAQADAGQNQALGLPSSTSMAPSGASQTQPYGVATDPLAGVMNQQPPQNTFGFGVV